MADHPTVQVREKKWEYRAGFLGIINGLFGTNEQGWGRIAMVVNVKCPNSCKFKDDGSLLPACPKCGSDLVEGEISKFILTEDYVITDPNK